MNITRDSSLFEVEQAHKTSNLKQIALSIGIGVQKLKTLLTFAGFEYDASTKKWRYALLDEKNDARNFSVYEIEMKMDNKEPLFSKNGDSNDSNEGNESAEIIEEITVQSNDISKIEFEETFNLDEIIALKELAALRIKNKSADISNYSNNDIINEIKAFKVNNVTRRTYAIDNDISNQLDDFCEKYMLKKSHVLSLALAKLFEKFE